MHPWWWDAEMVNAVAALVVALTGLASGVAIGRSRSRREREYQDAELAAIREAAETASEQTTNHHGTNLRDDVTAIQDRVDLVLDTLAAESRSRRDADVKFGEKLDGLIVSSQLTHGELFSRLRDMESRTSECQLSRLPKDRGL